MQRIENGELVDVPDDEAATIQAGWDAAAATTAIQAAYNALIASGLAIVSTGTSAINATYSLDANTLYQVQGLAVGCAAGMGFPAGASTFFFPDIESIPHTFTPTSIVDLFKAMRDFVAAADITLQTKMAGGPADWPSQPVTIA